MSKITLTRYRDVVYIVYTHDRQRFRVSTSITVADKYWKDSRLRKNHPDYEETEKLIKMVFSRVITASLAVNSKGLEPSASKVREEYIRMITPEPPEIKDFWGLAIIYTGIAGVSLRTRDYQQHFKGNNAGRSTLRKSLGVLFGYKQIPRDKDPLTGKTKFGKEDEQKLSQWMCQNLIMYFYPTSMFKIVEIELIKCFNPPLNLRDNHNLINLDFRQLLTKLRSNMDFSI